MFERYTADARRVVVLAQEKARTLNHNYIGTEHLLLAFGNEEEAGKLATDLLERTGGSLPLAIEYVNQCLTEGGTTPSGHIPFTPRSKKVLELALREALQLNHNWIGAQHLLLALVREGGGLAARALTAHGADLKKLREEFAKPDREEEAVKLEAVRQHNLARNQLARVAQQLMDASVWLSESDNPDDPVPYSVIRNAIVALTLVPINLED